MSSFRLYSILAWGSVLLIIALHVGYRIQFLDNETFWSVVHYINHPLGWIGSICMALSLLYIPRKKKWFRAGKLRFWYMLHVYTGLIGTLLISFHALGKYYGVAGINLFVVWMVMLTGIIGRFLYRKLPEELETRFDQRIYLLQRIQDLRKTLEQLDKDRAELFQDMDTHGIFALIEREADKKMPKSTLEASPGNILNIWREYKKHGRETKVLKKRLRQRAVAEREAATQREIQFSKLLQLELEARNLLLLNEMFSLWRHLHVPLSWMMWCLLALHIYAWFNY